MDTKEMITSYYMDDASLATITSSLLDYKNSNPYTITTSNTISNPVERLKKLIEELENTLAELKEDDKLYDDDVIDALNRLNKLSIEY